MRRFEVAARGILHIRYEYLTTPYALPRTTIVYASDLHFSLWAGPITQQLFAIVEQLQPDLLLLGGDLVDHVHGLPKLAACIRTLRSICPVWAIEGNHDRMVGSGKVRTCVIESGGLWLDSTVLLHNGAIRIDGVCRPQPDQDAFAILCTHHPAIFPKAVDCKYDLVLAGHLHGGQIVAVQHAGRLYPGAYISRWTGDRFAQDRTMMLVSRGVNDLFPLRWNCPREVIQCVIE